MKVETWAILATGPSMSQEIADQVKGKCTALVVSDAFRLAPWADVLVSQDVAWWKNNPDAFDFQGRRVCGGSDFQKIDGVERAKFEGAVSTSSNSGLLACYIAVQSGAKRLLLCGFDMGGSHFFGEHLSPLKNTTPQRFQSFIKQFGYFKPRGVEILNCTPGSALNVYPKADLHACLAES